MNKPAKCVLCQEHLWLKCPFLQLIQLPSRCIYFKSDISLSTITINYLKADVVSAVNQKKNPPNNYMFSFDLIFDWIVLYRRNEHVLTLIKTFLFGIKGSQRADSVGVCSKRPMLRIDGAILLRSFRVQRLR